MSRFDANMAAVAAPALFHVHGESVTVTAADGTETALTAIVGPERRVDMQTGDGRNLRYERDVTIGRGPTADYGGVASPAVNMTVTIGGLVYAVEAIENESENLARLHTVRIGVVERTRPGYRRNVR